MTGLIILAAYTIGCYLMAYQVTASFIEHPIRRREQS